MEHGGEPLSCHFDGEGFDLAGPHRLDAVADRREWEPSDSTNPGCPAWALCHTHALPWSFALLHLSGQSLLLDFQLPNLSDGDASRWASSISRAMPELTLPPQSHSSSQTSSTRCPSRVQFPVLLAQRHPTSVGRAGGRRWAYAPDGWHTSTPFSQTRCLSQYLLHRERRCKSVFLCSFRRPHCLYHGAGGVDR